MYLIADKVPEYDEMFHMIRFLESIDHCVGEVPPLHSKEKSRYHGWQEGALTPTPPNMRGVG